LGGNQELRVSVLRKTVVPGDVGRYKGGRIPTGSLLARKATRGRETRGNGKASKKACPTKASTINPTIKGKDWGKKQVFQIINIRNT